MLSRVESPSITSLGLSSVGRVGLCSVDVCIPMERANVAIRIIKVRKFPIYSHVLIIEEEYQVVNIKP